MISADHKRCSTRPSVDRPNYDLAKVFFVALRGQKEVKVAVAVLRGPPCPPWTNVLPLQFFVVLRGQKEVAVAVAVLRGPPCPPWTNVLPLQFFVVLRGQKKLQSPLQFSAALRVLRGQMCCRCSSSWPFADKRKLKSPLQFFVALRGPSWTKGSCSRRCSSPRPSVSSVDKCAAVAVLRGPSWAKEVAVAVAVLRGPPCPPWTNVLPLQFFVALRGQKKLQSPLQFSAALRVLRGQMCCRCSSSWPFVDKRKLQSPLQFFAALRVLRGQMCCRCSSSWPFVDKRKLQSPLQFSAALRVLRGQRCCRCSSSWPFVDKRKLQSPLQFSAALRVLRGQMCCRCSSSWPFVVLRGKRFPPLALRGQTKL